VLSFKPDMIFIYRGTHIKSATLRRIKAEMPETRIAGYNNDDPFSGKHPYSLWKHFLRCLPDYDIVFAYRRRNLEDFRTNGAKRVALLRSWFVPEYNYPVPLTAGELGDFSSDVVFIGHFERDGRLECLEELAGLNIKLRLYGHPEEWNHRLVKSPNLRRFAPVHTVWGEDYNRAICGSKIALCFLSKLNRDTYTRRCFEIPASGSLLLSEHSEDLESLFQRGIEADFFSNKKELIERIQYYLLHEEKRKKVARAGRECVVKNGHDVVSRMRYVLETLFQNSRS
ncbi:MAG: glycosyltransferase, partial [Spirochaetales bacterium]|nr:glycosyltransferase [Spirochaetales bacterium]